jgi:hypothetical protein
MRHDRDIARADGRRDRRGIDASDARKGRAE